MSLHNTRIWRTVYAMSHFSQGVILRFSPHVSVLERDVGEWANQPPYLLCPTQQFGVGAPRRVAPNASLGRSVAPGLWCVSTCNNIRNLQLYFTPSTLQPARQLGVRGQWLMTLLRHRSYLGSTFYVPSNEPSTFHPLSHNTILTGNKEIILQGHIVLKMCK